MATRIFTDEPVHSMKYDITAADWQNTPASVLEALQWSATKASEWSVAEARVVGQRGFGREYFKLLGYAKEWEDIADNAADELRSRDLRPAFGEG
jgi:hypothetical protein